MTWHILQGDARQIPLADTSVNCVVTSPPYFGLRDYGTGIWTGGDGVCEHRVCLSPEFNVAYSTLTGGKATVGHQQEGFHSSCPRCGAVRRDKQIGLESSLGKYLAALHTVFAEVWRILRADGTLWCNLGDSYAANRGYQSIDNKHVNVGNNHGSSVPTGLKPKDLCGVPWRVAFMLQEMGFYLRSDIIWHKPNPMPESVKDRCCKSHEYLFLLAKSEKYFYDQEAIAERSITNDPRRPYTSVGAKQLDGRDIWHSGERRNGEDFRTRNARSVWTIPTEAFPGSHFATMPTALVERCIKAGCPTGGVVFDPFAGAGTTPLVADRLGRHGVGLELNKTYCEMAHQRIAREAPLFAAMVPRESEQLSLLAR